MKKLLPLLAICLIFTGCGVTYHGLNGKYANNLKAKQRSQQHFGNCWAPRYKK
jgi:hypothetical protein